MTPWAPLDSVLGAPPGKAPSPPGDGFGMDQALSGEGQVWTRRGCRLSVLTSDGR